MFDLFLSLIGCGSKQRATIPAINKIIEVLFMFFDNSGLFITILIVAILISNTILIDMLRD
jgi:hypothetical protein